MTDDNELDPLARLRAADPAAGVEARAGFAADVVARATSEGAGAKGAGVAAEGGSASAADTTPADDLAAARSRRRRLWLPVAAVAASVAVFGGAGFALGATTSGGGATVAAAPISVGGRSADGGAGASEARKLAVPGATDQFFGFGRNAFTASGLATSTGSAKGYGYDPRAASDTATITSLATALGITTAPTLADGTWTAGKQDGTGPSLTVSLDGTLGFFYSDPPLYPSGCAQPGGPESKGGAESTDPAAPCEPVTPSLPSADAAVAALRTLVTATGRDAAAFAFTSETPDGAPTRTAQAWPVVDGQRVDQSWSLELTGAGIVSASGSLAPLVSLGDYPVVSEQQAFERLSDPRFGAQQTVMPFAARATGAEATGGDTSTGGDSTPSAPTAPPAAPTAGTPLSWPVHDVRIVSARLGLTTQWQPDGSVLVVPAYEFTDAEGGTWSVIAVAESKLDFGGE